MLDLDNFKYVNDTLGHATGDELIVRVADALRARLRETDVVARLGGDEFAIILPQTDARGRRARSPTALLETRARARRACCDGRRASASPPAIGIAPYRAADVQRRPPSCSPTPTSAMYDAKEAGRDRFAVARPRRRGAAALRAPLSWAERIRDALDDDALRALPAADPRPRARGAIASYELLLRMRRRRRRASSPPGAFLGIAERFGLIQEIDRWVVAPGDRSCSPSARPRAATCGLEVNLSGASIARPDGDRLRSSRGRATRRSTRPA